MADFKASNATLQQPYVTAGNRLYVIGTQDGLFPDDGGHINGEMAGVWSHPIKLLDGFFVGIKTNGETVWPNATSYRSYPFYTEHCYELDGIQLIRRQFVPDNEDLLFVTFEVTSNHTDHPIELVFAAKSDLRPGWLGTEEDGMDEVRVSGDALLFSDPQNPWFVAVATDAQAAEFSTAFAECPHETLGNGVWGALTLPMDCKPNQTETVRICIGRSRTGAADESVVAVHRGLASYDTMWATKARRYQAMEETSSIEVPSASISDMVRWVKFNTDWLDRDVPEVGSGLGAGLPEYPWWFGCDNGYALQGVLAAGNFDLAQRTLRLLATRSMQENNDGRIIHELSCTDTVYNKGNTQETPQFCMTVWETFTWTADLDFLIEMYPFVEKAVEWTLSMAPDNDGFPVGYGIMEVENLNAKLIDSAVYTREALLAYAKMSRVLGIEQKATQAEAKAETLREAIQERFWLEDEGLYADVLVDAQGMNQHLDKWADRQQKNGLDRAAEEYREMIDPQGVGEQAYLLKNWVISTPMEVGMATVTQAERALRRMRTPEFRGKDGLYLSGIDQTHQMTISTSVQAVAESRYGFMDETVAWLELMAGTRDVRVPGSISEMSPDYGCFVQAWTIYGSMVPLVRHMFGVQPIAHERRIKLGVDMPSDWTHATLKNLRVGDNVLSIQYRNADGKQMVTVHSAKDWKIDFATPVLMVGQAEPISEWWLQAGETVSVQLNR